MLSNSFKTVMAKYGDRVRLVMRHFPMNAKFNRSMKGFDMHPVACESALAAHCAGEKGLFWKMHDLYRQKIQGDDSRSITRQLRELQKQFDLKTLY